jgi:hypothetical protein
MADGEPVTRVAFGRLVSENAGLSFEPTIPERREAR